MLHSPAPEAPPTEPDASTISQLHEEISGLRTALASRDVIGQAKGIVMLLAHVDADRAFALLSRLSQDTNSKLIDVAAVVTHCCTAGLSLPSGLSESWQRHIAAAPVSPAKERSAAQASGVPQEPPPAR